MCLLKELKADGECPSRLMNGQRFKQENLKGLAWRAHTRSYFTTSNKMNFVEKVPLPNKDNPAEF